MITGLGVTLMILGILAFTVVDNFKPECLPWKRNLLFAISLSGAVLTILGYFYD
jgi:uncharacterized membrane protein